MYCFPVGRDFTGDGKSLRWRRRRLHDDHYEEELLLIFYPVIKSDETGLRRSAIIPFALYDLGADLSPEGLAKELCLSRAAAVSRDEFVDGRLDTSENILRRHSEGFKCVKQQTYELFSGC